MFTSRGEKHVCRRASISLAGLRLDAGIPHRSAQEAQSRQGPVPQAKGFVISREKDLPLHFGRDFLCFRGVHPRTRWHIYMESNTFRVSSGVGEWGGRIRLELYPPQPNWHFHLTQDAVLYGLGINDPRFSHPEVRSFLQKPLHTLGFGFWNLFHHFFLLG